MALIQEMLEDLETTAEVGDLPDDDIDFVETVLDAVYVSNGDVSVLTEQQVARITALWERYIGGQ